MTDTSTPLIRHLRQRLCALLGVLSVATVVFIALPARAEAAELSNVPDDTVQVDGRVSDVLLVGDRIYLAGSFLHVNGASRMRLASIDANTGQLTSWAPRANKWVMTLAASEDGSKIYAGGRFTTVNGVTHNRLVALDAATGVVDAQWNPSANDDVRALTVSDDYVYAGGEFATIDAQNRTRLAAINASTGALVPGWSPTASHTVRTLELSPGETRLYIGGYFNNISGQTRRGLAALDPTTGALSTWNPNPARPVIDLTPSSTSVFTAEGGGAGGEAAGYSAATGAELWSLHADGDAQAVTILDDKVYFGGHFLQLGGQTRRCFAAVDVTTGALDPDWRPSGGGGGVWALEVDPLRTRLYAGGDFTTINGQPADRFAQFSE